MFFSMILLYLEFLTQVIQGCVFLILIAAVHFLSSLPTPVLPAFPKPCMSN